MSAGNAEAGQAQGRGLASGSHHGEGRPDSNGPATDPAPDAATAESRSLVIAILGAESTGKSVLARALVESLRSRSGSPRVALVDEYLREFCDVNHRTPREDEQAAIAAEQARRIDEAAATHDIVVADTTAIMIAVYSEVVFGDTSLYPTAEHSHGRCDITLLTALDIPWEADGLIRDGPHVREPVDNLVRESLQRAGASYSVVHGLGPARLEAAEKAVARTHRQLQSARRPQSDGNDAALKPWRLFCDCCGDPDCERALRRLALGG